MGLFCHRLDRVDVAKDVGYMGDGQHHTAGREQALKGLKV